jgi:hypothetical protein
MERGTKMPHAGEAAPGHRLPRQEERSKEMIERFSRVVLTHDLPDEGLKAVDSGTVLDAYNKDGEAYDVVEFFALSGDTVAGATVDASALRPATAEDVMHSRTVAG